MSSFKKGIISGTIWSILGQVVTLSIILISNIIFARILSPKEFGQMGIIMFFIMLANVFAEGGLGGALIRKKDATKSDYSTVFVFNFLVSLFCFLLLLFSAGYIANYYNDSTLKKLIIVSGFVLIINAFQTTQNAKLVSEMKFKRLMIYRFVSVLLSTVIGLIFAYFNYGVWSLVIIQILSAGLMTILLCFFEELYLSFEFKKKNFKELYGFGVNTTAASLLNTAFDNVYQLILARYFSINQTGFYYQAKKLQEVPGGIINMLSQSVVFSSLSKLQDDKISFINAYNKILTYFLIILGFILIVTYSYAKQIILFLYGEKWIESTIYMQLLSVASFFYLLELINRVVFKVFNITKKILYLELIKKSIQFISILIGLYYSDVIVLLIGLVITNFFGYLINVYFSKKILLVKKNHELIVVLKVFFISLMTIFIVKSLLFFFEISGFCEFFSVPLLVLIYVGGLKLFKVVCFKNEFKNLINLYKK